MIHLPLTTTPIGWLVLGVGGYALYKAGKRKGEEEIAAATITEIEEDESSKEPIEENA
ncbi:MAG: hypothetical protein ACK5PS_19845 [Desulfopila sp.]